MYASRPRTDFPPPPRLAALSKNYGVASFAMLRVLSCFNSPWLRCLCSNAVQFCCDLEAHNLITTAIVPISAGDRPTKKNVSSGARMKLLHCLTAFFIQLEYSENLRNKGGQTVVPTAMITLKLCHSSGDKLASHRGGHVSVPG